VVLFWLLMVHISLLKVTENPALSSLLMEMRVKAISGACIASLNMVTVFPDLFGSFSCRSPIPIAFNVYPSAVVIFLWMFLYIMNLD
jgi:hypothetical protein